MTNKVLYHQGAEIGLRTKARVSGLSLQDDRLVIRGEPEVSIALESLRSVELFRLHGTGRMLKVVHEGGTLFVSDSLPLVRTVCGGQLRWNAKTAR